jgi:glycerophosphoryl diester phosphodiesterase
MTQVIAHRGASAYAAEHTLAAYDLALLQGADVLELDVRSTADGALVVLHDPTLARTAADPRAVASLTSAELAALPQQGRPLALGAVLARYGRAARYLIELKDPRAPMEVRVVEAVAAAGLRDRVVVQSFDELALRRVRHLDPGLPVAPLYEDAAAARRRLRAVAGWAAGVGVRWEGVDAGLLDVAHARGLAVRAWTVNAPREMARLVALGVDGLITDAPDVARMIAAAGRPAVAAAA